MKIDIGAYDKDTRQVPVTFTEGDIVHTRQVNACLDTRNRYDAKATATRVDDVARGVAHKIAVGAIVAEPAAAAEPIAEIDAA